MLDFLVSAMVESFSIVKAGFVVVILSLNSGRFRYRLCFVDKVNRVYSEMDC